jgi:hypothetical protein
MPIHQRLLAINARASDAYVAAESARARHRALHPTPLAAIKCMDGRVLFPTLTGTPVGLVQPFRAIGGRPEVFWPSFMGRLRHWVEEAQRAGQRSVLFVTYHFSASDPHLGCAGFDYDTTSARSHADKLARELAWVFGEELEAIVTGVETDLDRLVLHGPSEDVVAEALIGASDADIAAALARAFPAMDLAVRSDLVPIVRGNTARIAALRATPRPSSELAHQERVLAIGQGFDWLHEANLALIINDADPGLAHAIGVAARILSRNLEGAPDGEGALISCVPYHEPGIDRRQAIARSLGLLELARDVVRRESVALLPKLRPLAGILWAPARRFERLDVDLAGRPLVG